MELLLDQLIATTSDGTMVDPLLAEQIIVQNNGMARWASQQIALAQGVSANLQFQTPGVCLWQFARRWNPSLPEFPHRKEAMMWRIFELLPELLPRTEFEVLHRYLRADADNLRRLQVARAVANTFDRYLIYRPDWINRWEAGHDLHWQAVLWRRLQKYFPCHWATVMAQLGEISDRPPDDVLPPRISVFGVSDMPPLYTQVLAAVASHTAVHLFYLNPCEQYWADIVDEKQQARRRAKARKAGSDDPTGLLDIGNPLLASWGHAGQAFLDQLLELGIQEHEYFCAGNSNTRLQAIQNQILALDDARLEPGQFNDHSLQLHSCHSELREVQVLHDQLLSLFESLPALQPRDVLVMAPDIDKYAPFIDATFAVADDHMRIPWSISDRRFRTEQYLLEVIGWLLKLPLSRFESTEILALFDLPAIRTRFGIDQNTVTTLHRWVSESGIRWALDANMRTAMDLPATELNSWRFGLRRLFLGYALPDMDGGLYQDIAPYPDIEGAQSDHLQVLAQIITLCASWRQRLQRSYVLDEWLELLDQLIEDFLSPDENEYQVLQAARSRLFELLQLGQTDDEPLQLSRDVIADLYQQVLEDDSNEKQFLNGKVTFSNMVPMRSIPFRVVCVLGLNTEAFPRSDNLPSYDLIVDHPRRGDKRRRNDDRYLFLEALLSARDVFYLSYVGRDIRDHSEKAPSTVVSELATYAGVQVLEHPLQPFSKRYYDGASAELFSYNGTWYQAASATVQAQDACFVDDALDVDREPATLVELHELIGYFCDSTNSFLTTRLNIARSWREQNLETTEPFKLTELARWRVKQEAYKLHKAGDSKGAANRKLIATGAVPMGPMGDRVLDEIHDGALELDSRVLKYESRALESLEFDRAYGRYRLVGLLENQRLSGLFSWRFGKLRGKDLLECWIKHLVLCDHIDIGCHSVLVCEDWTVTFEPVKQSAERLQELLDIRHHGLMQPAPWLVENALNAWFKGDFPSLDASGKRISWNRLSDAQREEENARQSVWRGRQPLQHPRFDELSAQVLAPLFQHAGLTVASRDEAS